MILDDRASIPVDLELEKGPDYLRLHLTKENFVELDELHLNEFDFLYDELLEIESCKQDVGSRVE